MRILVTNDDGIYSPGLWALAEAASQFGEVWSRMLGKMGPDVLASARFGLAGVLTSVLRLVSKL